MTSIELRPDIEALYQAALDARHDDRLPDGIALCERAIALLLPDERRARALLHLELGFQTEEMRDLEGAARHYRISTENAPRFELASLALFHALLELDRRQAAYEEAVRFTAVRDSPEYRELFSSARYGEGLPWQQRELIAQARRNLANRK